jgi:hypothetical protein
MVRVITRTGQRHLLTRRALFHAPVCVMPTAAEHAVQDENRGGQIGQKYVHNLRSYYITYAAERQRCCKLSPNRLPSIATAAVRKSRIASIYAKLA